MHKNLFHRSLACALATILAVVALGVPLVHAAARLSNAALLASELPGGETLSSAPMKDVSAAIRAAVTKRPSAAGDIVRIAIMAKKSKHRSPACGGVSAMVNAAISAAPGQAREISEMATSVAPDCADAITQAVRGSSLSPAGGVQTTGAAVPGSTTGETTNTSTSNANATSGDPGAGPGFPGSPGFSGSSPSGGSAFANGVPPMPTPVPIPAS